MNGSYKTRYFELRFFSVNFARWDAMALRCILSHFWAEAFSLSFHSSWSWASSRQFRRRPSKEFFHLLLSQGSILASIRAHSCDGIRHNLLSNYYCVKVWSQGHNDEVSSYKQCSHESFNQTMKMFHTMLITYWTEVMQIKISLANNIVFHW